VELTFLVERVLISSPLFPFPSFCFFFLFFSPLIFSSIRKLVHPGSNSQQTDGQFRMTRIAPATSLPPPSFFSPPGTFLPSSFLGHCPLCHPGTMIHNRPTPTFGLLPPSPPFSPPLFFFFTAFSLTPLPPFDHKREWSSSRNLTTVRVKPASNVSIFPPPPPLSFFFFHCFSFPSPLSLR